MPRTRAVAGDPDARPDADTRTSAPLPVNTAPAGRPARRSTRRRLPSLTSLRAFEAAARHGSISRAADELCVTHAAISRHVAKLEASLDAKLFERSKGHIVLTRRGAAYASQLQRIFDDLHDVTWEQFDAPTEHSMLRIGVQSTFAIRFLIPRLARFKAQCPDLTVHVESSHKAVDPRASDVDVAIWLGHGDWPGLVATRLFDEEILPVASPRLLEQHDVQSPYDLREFLFLQVEARPDDWQTWFKAVGVRDVDWSRGLRLEYSALAYEGAVNALGIAMAQTMFVREDIARGRLVPVLDLPILTGRSYWTVHLESNPHAAAIARFNRWLKAEVADAQRIVPVAADAPVATPSRPKQGSRD